MHFNVKVLLLSNMFIIKICVSDEEGNRRAKLPECVCGKRSFEDKFLKYLFPHQFCSLSNKNPLRDNKKIIQRLKLKAKQSFRKRYKDLDLVGDINQDLF